LNEDYINEEEEINKEESTNRNVYILSIEGSKIYDNICRNEENKEVKKDYIGMLPYSLQLIKLHKQGLKTKKHGNKIISNDIINVKFRQKVRSAEDIIEYTNKKRLKLEKQKIDGQMLEKDQEYDKKLKEYTEFLVGKTQDPSYQEINQEFLRTKLYTEGFNLTIDKKTIEYVVYSRASSKSRTGQVLFIRKQLRDKMIKWQRLGMSLEGKNDIDYPGLLTYESLISSSIEGTIKIDPKNILLVDDVTSIFKIDCNIIEKEDNQHQEIPSQAVKDTEEKDKKPVLLASKQQEDYMMGNDIFDGEGLLDSSQFVGKYKNTGFLLLRQHMFKCAVFNTNIQQFLKDYASDPEHDINYDTWELTNMFGDIILAKDILMITTPNSLKALKFNKVKGSKPKMWEHWKKKIEHEDHIFGIVKVEHESQKGYDTEGNIINQMSYQMLNSIPLDSDDMKDLSQFELDYIEQLKNNNDVYIEYLSKEANDMNANQMLVDLYKKNGQLIYTRIFKDKRKSDIKEYVKKMKRGKIRLNGDYTTIVQNGKELLYHAVKQLPTKKNQKGEWILDYDKWQDRMILKENEAYTKLHLFDNEYVAFRNPHTSQSNVLILKNKDDDFISAYFNLTNNIIYTNAINFPINRILSGQDVDSDNLLLINNDTLLSKARKCYIKSPDSIYRVCENGVNKNINSYTVGTKDMAVIDNILAESQKNIGTVVNLGQLFMSTYWDLYSKDKNDTRLKELLEKIDICTILSEICIDNAKRMYAVDIKEQIDSLNKSNLLRGSKPLFFKYVSKKKDKDKKIRFIKYNCPMDYLQEIMNGIKPADTTHAKPIKNYIDTIDSKAESRKRKNIIEIAKKMINKFKEIQSTYNNKVDNNDKEEQKEKYRKISKVRSIYLGNLSKFIMNKETIHSIIMDILEEKFDFKYKLELLNILYKLDKDIFLSVFKEDDSKKLETEK
jgi:hypothetical protein